MGNISLNFKGLIAIFSIIDNDYANETQFFVQTIDI